MSEFHVRKQSQEALPQPEAEEPAATPALRSLGLQTGSLTEPGGSDKQHHRKVWVPADC